VFFSKVAEQSRILLRLDEDFFKYNADYSRGKGNAYFKRNPESIPHPTRERGVNFQFAKIYIKTLVLFLPLDGKRKRRKCGESTGGLDKNPLPFLYWAWKGSHAPPLLFFILRSSLLVHYVFVQLKKLSGSVNSGNGNKSLVLSPPSQRRILSCWSRERKLVSLQRFSLPFFGEFESRGAKDNICG